MVADGRIKGSGTGVVKVILPQVPGTIWQGVHQHRCRYPERGYGKKQAGFL